MAEPGLEAHLIPIRSGLTPTGDRPGLARWRVQELRTILDGLVRARARAWSESRSYLVRGDR